MGLQCIGPHKMRIMGQRVLGLPPWYSGLKVYSLQAGSVVRIQPHGVGSNPAWAKEMIEHI